MKMIVRFLELYLIVSLYWTGSRSFVFEDEGIRSRAQVSRYSSTIPTGQARSSASSATIDSVFAIPTTLFQSVSSAAQTFYPENANMISQLSDIPVQTLQAVGNLVNNVNTLQDERRQRLMQIRDQRRQQEQQDQLLQQQQDQLVQQQQLQTFQDQAQQDGEHTTKRRHILGGFGWASAFKDLFFGHKGGPSYETLFENNIYVGGHGSPSQTPNRRKFKKKKKKRRFSEGRNGDQQFFNDENNYQIGIDNILPLSIFSWQSPDRIPNKIAPGFDDRARSLY